MAPQTPADWLDSSDIIAPLHQLGGRDSELTGEWTCVPIRGGYGVSLGVWRVSGSGAAIDGDVPWSMVLKGWVRGDESVSPDSVNCSTRESDLYRSVLLNALPEVSAPVYYGTLEREGETRIWLENLTGLQQPEWSIERFASTARQLGRMNGAWLADRPLPDHPSLS